MLRCMALQRLLWRYLRQVLPDVQQQLLHWRSLADGIPNAHLRAQALASIEHKAFHCQGGSVFAAAGPREPHLLRFIVALQTISDYLDNLCDRAGVWNAESFRLLHTAMQNAVTPLSEGRDYYALYPYQDDGGYLAALVACCRSSLAHFPHYARVAVEVRRLVDLYIDLQVYKHDYPPMRLPQLQAWFTRNWHGDHHLYWQEYAAACGSTLAVFALCTAAAGRCPPADTHSLMDFYFPWVCGVHILLDYLIDLDEDAQGGDLNFVSYYRNLDEAEARIMYLVAQAQARMSNIKPSALAEAVLYGLPALYLSDGKVSGYSGRLRARRILQAAGPTAIGLYGLCKLWRRRHSVAV